MMNRVIDKFVAIGAVRAEVMYYGLPAWWKPEMSHRQDAVVVASSTLTNRYQVIYRSLLDDSYKKAILYKPERTLDMALFDYLRLKLRVSGIKEGYIYFPPNRSIIGLANRVELASDVALGPGTEYNEFFTPDIKWKKYGANDKLFIRRVLNLGVQTNGK